MEKEELLYRYFSNTLSQEERNIFNELLETDPAFKANFEFHNQLKQATKEHRHREISKKLQRFESDIIQKKQEENKGTISYWKIAASILFLVAASCFAYLTFSGTDYEELYAQNISPYPNTVYVITRSDTINTVEREAFVAYESGDYKLALAKMSTPIEQPYMLFYKAQSFLSLDMIKEAETLFVTIIETENAFAEESHWYLALIKIKQEDAKAAREYLEELLRLSDFKREEAQALLKRL